MRGITRIVLKGENEYYERGDYGNDEGVVRDVGNDETGYNRDVGNDEGVVRDMKTGCSSLCSCFQLLRYLLWIMC